MNEQGRHAGYSEVAAKAKDKQGAHVCALQGRKCDGEETPRVFPSKSL